MGPVRELVTLLTYRLNGFREAEAAFRSLQARAQQIGDVRFRATGLQQVQDAVDRLRASARGAVNIPVRATAGAGMGAPSVPTVPPMQVGLQGASEATSALASLRAMALSAAGAVAGIGAALSVKKLVEAGDQMTAGMDRLRAELEGTSMAAEVMYEKLFGLSRQTGIAADTGVTAFTNMHSAVREMGGTADQVLTVIAGIQKAGAVSGAKATDVAEVLRQTSQALSGGVLNGEELRILKERLGPFAREFAQAMGVPYGQLKKLGAEGKLVSEKVFPAMLAAAQKFDDKFGKATLTFDRARGIANVTLTRFLADLDKGIGLSNALARGLTRFSDWLDRLRSYLPVVQQVVTGLGGIDQMLEVIAASATAASLALTPMLAKLVIPTAIVAGIVGVGLALQDLWTWARGGRGSLAEELFGDFGPVRDRAVAALDAIGARLRALRDEIVTGLGFESAGDLFAAIEARFAAFAATTRREWEALRAAFTSDAALGTLADTFSGLARAAESMWAIVGPIIRGLIGGPSEMAREWGNIRAAIGDPLKAIGGFFDDVWQRATNVYNRLTELADKLRNFMASVGLLTIPKGETVSREPFGPPAPPGTGPRTAPRAAPAPMNDLGLPFYQPSSYGGDLAGRMFRGQTAAYSAAQTNQISQTVNINATGNSAAEIASAAQAGVGRANRDAFGASDSFARAIGFDMSRTEMAAA